MSNKIGPGLPDVAKYNEYSKNILGGETSERKRNAKVIYHIIWNKINLE